MLKTTLGITTFNRGHLLKNSLERLTHLTLPDDILVVDDGGTDDTNEIVQSFNKRLPIRYIYNNNPTWSICSFARNIIVKNTDADIIITSEPELLFVTDIVKQMLEEHKNYPDQIISAGVVYHAQQYTKFHPGLLTDPKAALNDETVEEYQIEPRPYTPNGYCVTRNMQATFTALYERKWLLDLGGWDEEFKGPWGWDDVDLATRLRINGINQHICPEMEVVHQFHEHLPPHIQGPGAQINEQHMIDKQLSIVEKEIFEQKSLGTYNEIDPRLIANKNHEWGIIKQ